MARQYDVEDLLNSDATDPDGEDVPAATNDEVQEGKFVVETAAGTGKNRQCVADRCRLSTEVSRVLYRGASLLYRASCAWDGVDTVRWQLFLHGLDDGGLSERCEHHDWD